MKGVVLYTMISTMKISDETKKELLRIGAEYTIKDGRERSLEEVVKILIEERRHKNKRENLS
jgi:hypothetical protein